MLSEVILLCARATNWISVSPMIVKRSIPSISAKFENTSNAVIIERLAALSFTPLSSLLTFSVSSLVVFVTLPIVS